jgi:hypothetical protein
MKLSALITTKAIEFALTKNAVLTALGPVDHNLEITIRQVIAKLAEPNQQCDATVQIIFDYINIANGNDGPKVMISVDWFKSIGFTLGTISILP